MVELVKAYPDNKQALQSICRAAYEGNFGSHWDGNGLEIFLEDQFGDQRISQDLQKDQVDYFFIQYQNEAVGFVKINHQANLEGYPNQATAELEKIYILPQWKGQGLGKQALQICLDNMWQRGAQTIGLYVIDTNLGAISFYQKAGFQKKKHTRLELPLFKEELRGMYLMVLELSDQ